MQLKSNTILFGFTLFLLTCINLFIYLKKDQFAYIPHEGYSGLYTCSGDNCLGEWQKVKSQFNESDLKRAAKILKDSANVNDVDATDTKAKKMYDFLYMKFWKQMGDQSPFFNSLTTFQKYDTLCTGKATLFCSTFSEFIYLFSWSMGVPCRYIEMIGTHAVNEIYLAEEGIWQHVDLTANIFSVIAEKKKLNTVDLIKLQKTDERIRIMRANNFEQTIKAKDILFNQYYRFNTPILFYKNTDWSENYKVSNKLIRYVFPTSYTVVYQERPKSNMKYYIKVSVLILWIINALMLTYLLYNDRSKKYKESLQRQNSN